MHHESVPERPSIERQLWFCQPTASSCRNWILQLHHIKFTDLTYVPQLSEKFEDQVGNSKQNYCIDTEGCIDNEVGISLFCDAVILLLLDQSSLC